LEKKIEDQLKKMTLEEKLRLTTGDGMWRTMSFPALEIPSITMSDGTNGIRFQKEEGAVENTGFIDGSEGFDSEEALQKTYKATCFPSGSTISCSWDRNLLKDIAHAIASECHEIGISLLLGPGVNIRRHPLTARNFEYYSEDPCLSGEMGAAMVSGLKEKGIGSCPKHFVCHNSDDFRTRVDAIVDQRALREIYLASFERVVTKSRPASVMTAYNSINGVYASENAELLNGVLKREWGFEGAVITDWGGVCHPEKAAVSGLDLHMPESMSTYRELQKAYAAGTLPMDSLDERVRRILKMVYSLSAENGSGKKSFDFKAHHSIAQTASLKSSVLLKNKDASLPLGENSGSICVLGALAEYPLYQGTGCAIINAVQVDSPLEEIRKAAGGEVGYAPGYPLTGTEADQGLIDDALAALEKADTAVVFLGCYLPEESDLYNRKNIRIEASHLALLTALQDSGKRIIAVLNSGDSVEMPWIDSVDALMYTGFGGEGCGKSLADLLFGKTSPSGKLSMTIPRQLKDNPAATSVPGDRFRQYYGESLFVGYRYYDYKEIDPLFPFGFGLSYTDFSYDRISLSAKKLNLPAEELTVNVQISNCGKKEGDEVIQLYVNQKNPSLPRPPRELKDFARITLKPGETGTVEFTLSFRDFAYYDPISECWKADQDEFVILAGSSSRDIRLSESVQVSSRMQRTYHITPETGFTEVFSHPEAETLLFDFLLKQDLIAEEDSRDEVKTKLTGTFWGMFSFFDMNSRGAISYGMVHELAREMNLAVYLATRKAD